jgi:S-DNA-T family DNA segregation ATPase FtsK/SpoIIIE
MRRQAGERDEAPEERDPLFEDAVRVILESQRGSVSLLQRKLGVGYSRAARLIDIMADCGLVGDYKGSQAREVMMTLEDWEAERGDGAQG